LKKEKKMDIEKKIEIYFFFSKTKKKEVIKERVVRGGVGGERKRDRGWR
jgi:hypothetical protein